MIAPRAPAGINHPPGEPHISGSDSELGATAVQGNRIPVGGRKPRGARATAPAAGAAATGAMFTGAPAQARQAHQAASASGSPFAPKTSDPDHDGDPDLHSACNAVHHRGQAACFAMKVIDMDTYIGPDPPRATRARAGRQDHARPSEPAGYSPALLQRAYRLPPGRGSGRTSAVVAAYAHPHPA